MPRVELRAAAAKAGGVEAAEHDAVDLLRRIRAGHGDGNHAFSRVAEQLPERRRLPLAAVDELQVVRSGRLRVKSKMPCLAGFLPVMKLDQAGNVIGGSVRRSSPCVPFRITSAMFGSLPWQPTVRSGRTWLRPSQ